MSVVPLLLQLLIELVQLAHLLVEHGGVPSMF